MSRIRIGVKNAIESVTWYNAIELDAPKPLDFWQLLNANWQEWINHFSIWWLKRKKLLQETAHKNVKVSYETVTFETDKIFEEIRHHLYSLYDRYGEFPSVVYIGRDIHAQTIRLHLERYVMTGRLNPDHRSPHPITQLLGVEVVFVPWMEGIFAWNPSYADR